MCERCCLLITSGTCLGEEAIPHWEKDDPLYWEYTPKFFLKREKGRNPELDLTVDNEVPVGTEERLKERGENGSLV